MDEMAKRRPTPRCRPGRCHPVTLADGQRWLIPRPCWWIQPRFKDARVVATGRHFGYSSASGVDDLVEALPHADPETAIGVVATIAAELLSEVYDLTPDELDTLLCVDPAAADPLRWARDVVAVATFSAETLPEAKDGE